MKKTRIAFEDIKAGDLLEAVTTEHGVKMVCTGVAFERAGSKRSGIYDWQTSQGGAIVSNIDEAEIYRIDVVEVKFEDIRKGDKIRVVAVFDDVETTVTGRAGYLGSADQIWFTDAGQTLVSNRIVPQTIEILERGE